MGVSKRIITIFCLAILQSGCEGASGENNSNGQLFLPFENTETNVAVATLDARQIEILGKIKQRSSDDGALYQFDELNPVFEQDGDTITVNFEYINPNTVGGAPIVEYSVVRSTITSIVYTQ